MKILNVIDLMNQSSAGGSATRTYGISKSLAELGEDVEILTTNWDLDISYVASLNNVKWHSINSVLLRYLFPIKSKKWLEKNICKYDAIHITKNWSILAGIAAQVAKKKNVPYVFSGMGLIDTNSRSKFIKSLYKKIFTKPTILNAAACIAVTQDEKQELINLGFNKDKIYVIPNGIDLADFKSSKIAALEKNTILAIEK